MEEGAAGKLRRLEHPRGVSDALRPSSSSRLEDLPEEIKHFVLSLLPLKEAARTSILSRNWRTLWTHFPNLCFGTKELLDLVSKKRKDRLDRSTNDDSVKIQRAVFIETVNSIIQQHSGIGLNKFSIRCNLRDDSSDHIDRWIRFATTSKAKIIDMNLWPRRNNVRPTRNVYRFPLDALDAQDGPFVQSLFLTNVSIETNLVICGFRRLKRLHLHCVHIIGDLPGLLINCSSLEDLELIACSGVTDLNIPHQFDKLRCLLISNICVQMVEFHVPDLSHFEYRGGVIPIVLHGCPTLEEVTLKFHALIENDNNRALSHVITGIPSISTAKVLNVHTEMGEDGPFWSSQVHKLTRPACMFLNLRHLTCTISIFTMDPNNHTRLLLLAHYLDSAPQLETLQLHMCYVVASGSQCWDCEEASFHMCRLNCLKTVYMSGFQCYRPEVEVLCGILANGSALENVTIELVRRYYKNPLHIYIPEYKIRDWAHRVSQRYGKVITVAKAP